MRRGEAMARLTALLFGTAAWLLPAPGWAEVSTDGTLGRKVRLTGPDVRIGADLGQVRGKNLFHSFQRFGVDRGGRVTFTGPDGLDNVISRVTGGEASRIDGTLASEVGRAAVWLVNPSGIVFGPGARLDVPGSFHASTADEVRFGDGARFSALDPGGSTLSVAPLEAFGFLGGRSADIRVDESILRVPAGEALSLVGGDVLLTGPGGEPPEDGDEGRGGAAGPGAVLARGGRVALAGVGAAASSVAVATGEVAGEVAAGEVRLDGRALADASGDGGGTVRIVAGRLAVGGGSVVSADNPGGRDARAGAGVAVEAGSVEVVGDGSEVSADVAGAGRGGAVTVQAEGLRVLDEGRIGSRTFGAGDAGPVTVRAWDVEVADRGRIVSSSRASAVGDAGAVAVRADSVQIRAGGEIGSSTFGAGGGGSVVVEAGSLLIAGAGMFTGIRSQTDPGEGVSAGGNAGTVAVRADELTIRGVGALVGASSSEDGGDAGVVEVEAGRLRIVEGTPPGQRVVATTGIASQALSGSLGDAGSVRVRADHLEVGDRSRITSTTFAEGRAGAVTVEAGSATIRDRGLISSDSGEDGAGGDAGVVRVEVRGDLTISRGGTISSATRTTGDAGAIGVEAGRLLIEGGGAATGIRGQAEPSEGVTEGGDAGRVTVEARELTIRGIGGVITTSSLERGGDAGTVRVEAGRLRIVEGTPPGQRIVLTTGIASQALTGSLGDAGSVEVEAESIEIDDRGRITSSSFSDGRAGNVTIEASRVTVQGGGLISSSADAGGVAGDIDLDVGVLLVEDASVQTIGASNAGGRITVEADDAIGLVDAEVTSDGELPVRGRSLISLEAPAIALVDGSRVTSLTNGVPVPGSGEASIDGELTFISEDSLVAASTTVELAGVDNQVGTGLQISPGAFLDAEGLLGENCAARDAGRTSSFTRAGRKGGLPPSPDRPLPSAGAARAEARQALLPGGVLRVASAGCAGG